jgi:LysR family transcriptional regulator, chromosome initiation inhibitor
LPSDFVSRALGLRAVTLIQRFVPSLEGQVSAALAGWGVGVLPEIRVRSLLASGELVNLAPQSDLPIDLYWHCWNLDSAVIDSLTTALSDAAKQALG